MESNRLDSRNDQSKMKLGLNKAVGFTVARNETSMETFPEKTDRQADVTITDRSQIILEESSFEGFPERSDRQAEVTVTNRTIEGGRDSISIMAAAAGIKNYNSKQNILEAPPKKPINVFKK